MKKIELLNTLFIVPTPIGNLSDISQRAIECLTHVDLIACEDTRHSAHLLNHFGINTKTISLHEHNEREKAQKLISFIQQGNSLALISDAGTPLISDPGYFLVNQCRDNNILVVPLPGPCALTTALSASGLPTDRFCFFGFLPVKRQAKLEVLKQAQSMSMTCIFYESPKRIRDTLESCKEIIQSEYSVVLAKELTKSFETFVTGSCEKLISWLDEDSRHQKGEFVLMLHCEKDNKNDSMPSHATELMSLLVGALPTKKAASIVSEHYGLKKNELYQYAIKHLA